MAVNVTTISAERAFEVLNMNKRGEKPLKLNDETEVTPSKPIDLAEQESLTRFDKSKRKGNKHHHDKQRHNGGHQEQRPNHEHRHNRGDRRSKRKGNPEN